MEMCGKPEIVTLEVVSGSPNLPVTRNGLMNGGIEIVESCRHGDFLIIELTGTKDAWMIGEVTKDGGQFISKLFVHMCLCEYAFFSGSILKDSDAILKKKMVFSIRIWDG
jgi:hypothetical protein